MYLYLVLIKVQLTFESFSQVAIHSTIYCTIHSVQRCFQFCISRNKPTGSSDATSRYKILIYPPLGTVHVGKPYIASFYRNKLRQIVNSGM